MKEDLRLEDIRGISQEEASRKIAQEGYNELPSAKGRSVLTIAFEVVKEPMFLLLIACGTIYLILGDVEEALMLMCFVFFVMGITIYQERKTERALDALRDLSSPRALVIRDGSQMRIAGREVVTGDILVLSEGDRVPADAIILISSHILVDESLLTGESVPVRKVTGDSTGGMGRPGGDDQPYVYSGTMVVQGRGIAVVKATGMKTEMGRIGKALQTLEEGESPLEAETAALVKKFALVGLVLCTIVVIVYSLTRGDLLGGVLAGITLAMAMVPEEIPVVITIFLALGAWRISQKNVLTRRLQAIQALGAATVLCVDKTGTITKNRMMLRRIFAGGRFHDLDDKLDEPLPDEFHELLEYSILASQADPFDPMEKSIKKAGEKALSGTEHIHKNWKLIREYPLSHELLALSHVWNSPDGTNYVIAAKGAPEAIADLCHFHQQQVEELSKTITNMAADGLRVLGVAKAHFRKTELPEEQHDFRFEYVGLVGFTDPVRDGIEDAISECYQAGIRVVMITGDYPITAQNIARQIGLRRTEDIVTGPELENMSEGELKERLKGVDIFARVVPEQKLLIVNAIKANNEVVAMTGDGVNDAPALKSAHIGIAMGSRGTDVARESADLVLLEDDFSSIVEAIKLGRRIFDNLKKALAYILAIHVPIAGMSLLPVIMRWPLALMPAHIAFLELIIDPACSVVFEAEPAERDVMRRPPRRLGEPLFSRKAALLSLLQGLMVLIIVANAYILTLYFGGSENKARTIAFVTLVVANLGLILTNRSWSHTIFEILRAPNSALKWVVVAALLSLCLAVYVPFLRGVFRFEVLTTFEAAACLGAGVLSIAWFEAMKILNRRTNNNLLPA